MPKKRLLSGIQPTGKMHLGNYLGAVKNWVSLQETYESFFMIVDLHALTSVYENPGQLKTDKLNLAIDILAAGIDPAKCALYFQSDVPEHAELHLILSMITPLPWVERVPTYKSKLAEIKEKDLNTYGFLGYPILQAADIMLFKSDIVPVGEDQLPHIELTREIARRFNHLFKTLVFPEPKAQLTNFPVLPGTDGRKMSKSYGNTLPMSASVDEMNKLIMKMVTDPARIKRDDPGNPDICPVFAYQKIFNTTDRNTEIDSACRKGEIGCVMCKKELASRINDQLSDFRKQRSIFEADTAEVYKQMQKGADKAREVAAATLKEVKGVIGL